MQIPLCGLKLIKLDDIKNLRFNPLTRISQKTGSRFVKTHGLYKNRPS